jgi:hypothetical protein
MNLEKVRAALSWASLTALLVLAAGLAMVDLRSAKLLALGAGIALLGAVVTALLVTVSRHRASTNAQ